MINFNKPFKVFNFKFDSDKLSGDGKYTKLCTTLIEKKFKSPKALLTTSCTDALEMAAILLDIKPGDEVISPSYTFVSTVNAFVLRGAKIIFVDIRADTMNIDEKLIEAAITNKTRAIIAVHYAGVPCEMDTIISIAKRNKLYVIEDAAQGVMSKYKNKFLGSIGDMGTYSFHETKNYTMGEGGALLIQNDAFINRAEIIREKGTNRKLYLRGQVDKYTWVDIGSSFLPSDINAAYLYPQLLKAEQINNSRLTIWETYYNSLLDLQDKELIDLPFIPENCNHNAHMFYIKCKNIDERSLLINYLKQYKIQSVFHYIPLHTSPAGLKFGHFHGIDHHTTLESERLLRLPMYFGLKKKQVIKICNKIKDFYSELI